MSTTPQIDSFSPFHSFKPEFDYSSGFRTSVNKMFNLSKSMCLQQTELCFGTEVKQYGRQLIIDLYIKCEILRCIFTL